MTPSRHERADAYRELFAEIFRDSAGLPPHDLADASDDEVLAAGERLIVLTERHRAAKQRIDRSAKATAARIDALRQAFEDSMVAELRAELEDRQGPKHPGE